MKSKRKKKLILFEKFLSFLDLLAYLQQVLLGGGGSLFCQNLDSLELPWAVESCWFLLLLTHIGQQNANKYFHVNIVIDDGKYFGAHSQLAIFHDQVFLSMGNSLGFIGQEIVTEFPIYGQVTLLKIIVSIENARIPVCKASETTSLS